MLKNLIRAERELWTGSIALYVAQERQFGFFVADPVVMREAQLETERTEPCLRLKYGEAQMLMDELWNCGIRPSEGTGSAGSLRATEKHLGDMQRIAFMLLERPNA